MGGGTGDSYGLTQGGIEERALIGQKIFSITQKKQELHRKDPKFKKAVL